jgi:hypothetical protein
VTALEDEWTQNIRNVIQAASCFGRAEQVSQAKKKLACANKQPERQKEKNDCENETGNSTKKG